MAATLAPTDTRATIGAPIPYSFAGLGHGDRPHAPDEYIAGQIEPLATPLRLESRPRPMPCDYAISLAAKGGSATGFCSALCVLPLCALEHRRPGAYVRAELV